MQTLALPSNTTFSTHLPSENICSNESANFVYITDQDPLLADTMDEVA